MVMRALKRNTAGQKNRHLELGGVGRLVRWVLREALLGCGDVRAETSLQWQRNHVDTRGWGLLAEETATAKSPRADQPQLNSRDLSSRRWPSDDVETVMPLTEDFIAWSCWGMGHATPRRAPQGRMRWGQEGSEGRASPPEPWMGLPQKRQDQAEETVEEWLVWIM